MTEYNHLTDPNRKGRITASMVGAILGHAPYMTRGDAMRTMVRAYHGAEPEFKGNVATEYGNANEPNAILDFELETGLTVHPVKFMTREDWAGCSPDGCAMDGMGVETKCPYSLRKGGQFKTLDEQPHYYDQVQFSLWVSEWKGWYFVQWQPGAMVYEPVYTDQSWQDENLPELRQFYAEYLSELDNPEHLQPKRVVIDTPEAARMVREWDELCEQEERAKERKKDLLADMVQLAGEKNADFAGRKLTLVEKAGSVSYAKAIKELAPDADLEKWRGKPTSYWGLR